MADDPTSGRTHLLDSNQRHSAVQHLLDSLSRAGGAHIDRYELLRVLGRGATSVVFAAFDRKLERRIALKVIPAGMYGEADRADRHVLAEARAVAQITHPNVITVHEVGTTPDGNLFLSMELVDGETLRLWNRRSPADPRPRHWGEVLEKYVAAGRGLAAVHEAGFVHSDFKADNVLLGPDGVPRVTDFGLARGNAVLGAPELPNTPRAEPEVGVLRRSTAMLTLGTPAYMSPEQHRREAASPRSDQFSFCAALWEAVYGTLPFEGADFESVRQNVLSGKVVRPPKGSTVPGWLWAALERGLSADPDRRWPDLDALLNELERDRGRSRRVALALSGVIAVLGAGYLVGETMRRDLPVACTAGPQRADARWNGTVAEQIRAALVATEVDYAEDTSNRVVLALDQHRANWDQELTRACEDTVDPIIADARSRCLMHRLDEMGALVEVLIEANSAVVSNAVSAVSSLRPPTSCTVPATELELEPPRGDQYEAVNRTRAEIAAVRALESTGQFQAAMDRVESLDLVPRDYAPLEAEYHAALAQILASYGSFEEAAEHSKIAFFLGRGCGHTDAAGVGASNLSFALFHLGKPNEAVHSYRSALPLLERAGKRSLTAANLHQHAAEAYAKLGNIDRARALFSQAVDIKRERLGASHLDLARTLNNYGGSLEELGFLSEAESAHLETLRIMREHLGEKHPTLGMPHFNLGEVFLRLGRLDSALSHARKTEKAWSKSSDYSMLMGLIPLLKGSIALAQSEFRQALSEAEAAEEAIASTFGPKHERVGRAVRIQGESHIGIGNFKTGLALLERAAEIQEDSKTGQRGLTDLALARALAQSQREPNRVLELATAAHDQFSTLGPGWQRHVDEAEAFLAEIQAPADARSPAGPPNDTPSEPRALPARTSD